MCQVLLLRNLIGVKKICSDRNIMNKFNESFLKSQNEACDTSKDVCNDSQYDSPMEMDCESSAKKRIRETKISEDLTFDEKIEPTEKTISENKGVGRDVSVAHRIEYFN
ncbi:hypothetical protein VNO78_10718 [Psophocarpus tetragonolobus]|uniref:Uncharacterized protein n=1 Tax=Psophocarpus tetragonolobus TaxID=3891 RepID=A0AAN9XMH2_PSOTE